MANSGDECHYIGVTLDLLQKSVLVEFKVANRNNQVET